MASGCRCSQIFPRKKSRDLECANGDAVTSGCSSGKRIIVKSTVPCNCLATLSGQGHLSKVIAENVRNKRQTITLLIHQLNQVRRELAMESNGKTEAEFRLDQANYQLNRIKSTPVSELIVLEMKNYNLEQTNRLLLKQFDRMKKVITN